MYRILGKGYVVLEFQKVNCIFRDIRGDFFIIWIVFSQIILNKVCVWNKHETRLCNFIQYWFYKQDNRFNISLCAIAEYIRIEQLHRATHLTSVTRRHLRDLHSTRKRNFVIIFEARARNDGFEIQDGGPSNAIFVRRLTQPMASRDFHAIAETDGCDDLQFFRFTDISFSFYSFVHIFI